MSAVKNIENEAPSKCHVNWGTVGGLVMIFVCACGLIAPFVIQNWNHKTNEITIHMCSVDSISKDVVLSAADAVAVVRELERKEADLEEKYNYVLRQKENEFRWQNYMSYVIGIIVAICGFFGYKSIRDLKDDVSKTVSDSAEKETRKYLDEKLNEMVNGKVEECMDVVYNSESMRVAVDKLRGEMIAYFDKYFDEILRGTRTLAQIVKADPGTPAEQMQELESGEDLNEMFNGKES